MDHPLPWLRYLDASDVDAETIEFDGLKVRNAEMETLGKVEGFIVDSQNARPYYVVVDSGGWFKSKHFLLPVGHGRIDGDNDALVVDLPKARIDRFPGFDKDKFLKMSESDLQRFNDETCTACGAGATAIGNPSPESFASQWSRSEYAMPAWWAAEPLPPERIGDMSFSAGAEYPPSKVARPTTGSTVGERFEAEQVRAKGADPFAPGKSEDSPFFDGRAQPGDVIGLDTGGEVTHVGDTAEDENTRRRAAEEAVKKGRG